VKKSFNLWYFNYGFQFWYFCVFQLWRFCDMQGVSIMVYWFKEREGMEGMEEKQGKALP